MSEDAVVRLAATTSGFILWASVLATFLPALFFTHYRDRAPSWLRRVVLTPVVLLVVYHILYVDYDYSKRISLSAAWVAAVVFAFPMTLVERLAGSVALSAAFAATTTFPVGYAIASIAIESATGSTLMIIAGGLTLLVVVASCVTKDTRSLFNSVWVLESVCFAVLVVNGINAVLVNSEANDPEEFLRAPETLVARAVVISGLCTLAAARSVVCFVYP